MKTAGERAELPRENIIIALEPEVATIYCLRNQLKVHNVEMINFIADL